ncbi:Uncharacterised protein [Legionella spiritensis]|nr:Uncharacterised protein [Legionella spiritensis]
MILSASTLTQRESRKLFEGSLAVAAQCSGNRIYG